MKAWGKEKEVAWELCHLFIGDDGHNLLFWGIGCKNVKSLEGFVTE